ncbi:MAG: penicillin-binding protein [Oscillospiraceae bacterium]|nr:penicillin-binding protein [Oscillospiraceae bacterium]
MTIKKYSKKPAQAKKADTAQQAAKPAKKSKGKKGIIKTIIYWCCVLACLGVMLGSVAAVWLASYLVNATKDDDRFLNLNDVKLAYTTILYAEDPENPGQYIEYHRLRNDTENRVWVDLDQIPQDVIDAFIAIEDNSFYTHKGINIKRTIAAAINEYTPIKLFSGRQGASTITQQLVKNLTEDMDVEGMGGLFRKLREIFRAWTLEKNYSKDMILEAYLNTLRLSGQLGGVQAGANVYFDKDISEVTLAQAASIAAITNAPTYYSPIANPENNVERRDYILYLMLEEGMITQEEYDTAIAEELVVVTDHETVASSDTTSYFTDMVIDQVIKDLQTELDMTAGEATSYIYSGGLRIYTTVNPLIQTAMEEEYVTDGATFGGTNYKEATVTDKTTGEKTIIYPQAAMAVIDYDGRIVGVVGGLGEKTADRSLNRAVDSVRPVGSTMKPIGAYAPALDMGYINYSTGLPDMPFKKIEDPETGEERDWPRNYVGEGIYEEVNIPVVHAIERSLNTIAVWTVDMLGPENAYDFLTNTLNITSLVPADIDHGPMALGSLSYGISPLEMAAAYAMFGNGGVYTTPYCYTTVETAQGDIILEKQVTTVQAISEDTAYIMNRALRQVIVGSRGTAANVGGPNRMEAVGKTGTTSDDMDHWFIGLTPYYCTASWWGYDEQIPLSVNYAKHPPTLAWKNVMNIAQENLEYKNFPTSDGVITLTYCKDTGDLATESCPNQATGYYTEDNKPATTCYMH